MEDSFFSPIVHPEKLCIMNYGVMNCELDRLMNNSDFFALLLGRKKDPVRRAIDLAIEHLEAGECDAAILVLREKALGLDPGNRRALLHLGVAHMLKGELDLAEEILTPVARWKRMDSESAAAQIALDKIAADRKKMQ